MPAYLAPGVFVEEVSFRAQSIEGLGTSTAGFVGPCRDGPVTSPPPLLASLADFERLYGDGQALGFGADGGTTSVNFLHHAVASFFEEGGRRLHVSRVFRPRAGPYPSDLAAEAGAAPHADGHARLLVGHDRQCRIVARHPGAFGNLQVRFSVQLGSDVLGARPAAGGGLAPVLDGLADGELVWVSTAAAALQAPSTGPSPPARVRRLDELPLYIARRDAAGAWTLSAGVAPAGAPSGATSFALADFAPRLAPGSSDSVRRVTLSLAVLTAEGRPLGEWPGLSLDPARRTAGAPDGLFDRFGLNGPGAAELPVVLLNGSAPATHSIDNGSQLLQALDAMGAGLGLGISPAEWQDAAGDELTALRRKFERGLLVTGQLTGGNDGLLPGPAEYEGRADPAQAVLTGLKAFEALDDIAIVAAPGATWAASSRTDDVAGITRALITHAEHMRYRIAVLDPHERMGIADVRRFRAGLDSSYAALYYPWVTVRDGATGQPLNLPPSGFVAGIYARTDGERGVHKAPANEVVRSAIGFESVITATQQDVLNPEGINCFRFFQGRGHRLWGARTLSADPAWQYVNLRRYLASLEHSIDRGTQWAVFEPNGEALWANVRTSVDDFLHREWANGALLGDKPEQAFFVKCDRATMTQNDLDNGRLVCVVGVAPLKPAEFVIFRIGHWTADRST